MKNLKNKLPFIFFIAFVLLLSVFSLGGNISFSFASSLEELGTDIFTSSITFNGESKTTDFNFEANYNATNYELSLNDVSDVSAFKWYFANGEDYSLLENTSNTLQIKNCIQSGKYVCVVTTADGEKRTEPITITINPKKITFSNFSIPESKVYDGTTKVNVTADYAGIIDGDDVNVEVIGNTSSPNAYEQRPVLVTPSDIKLTGSASSNYIVDENLPTQTLLIDITKMPITLNWESTDNKTDYDYNGQDQIWKIKPYYNGLRGERVNLLFTIEGYSILNGVTNNFSGEFLNSGTYNATATLTLAEANYEVSNLTKTFRIKRVSPVVTVENTSFTYNGKMQDAKRCVTIDNTEQILKFTDSTFTTVNEGNNKEITVSANESLNFLSFTRTFTISVSKAKSVINVDNVKKEYVYTGSLQKIDSGATINNTEQTLYYSNNTFTTVAEGNDEKNNNGNGLVVSVFANPSDNYDYVSTTFTIKVDRATIDTSNWKWNYTNPYTYSKGVTRRVYVTGFPANLVTAEYFGGYEASDVDVYEAEVRFTLIDSDNFYPLEGLERLLTKTWRINKQKVTKPIAENVETTYNSQNQTLPIAQNALYSVTGNTQCNAGNYIVTISLIDTKNFEWNNGNSDALTINWKINKAKIETPKFDLSKYDGTEGSINIDSNSPYYIIYGDEKFILLGLNDEENYAWEDSSRAYLRIDIGGGFFDGPALPIFVICLTLATIVLIAVYFAVHSTIIISRHRRKVALIKARKVKRQLTLASGESLAEGTTFTSNFETPKAEKKDEILKTIETITSHSTQEVKAENAKKDSEIITIKPKQINKNEQEDLENAKFEKENNNNIIKQEVVNSSKKQDIVNSVEINDTLEETQLSGNLESINAKETNKPQKRTATRTSNKTISDETKTRKPYTKSRKIENRKKVAEKKKASLAKKTLAKKEAEKKKTLAKKEKAKATAKKTNTASKKTNSTKTKITTTKKAKDE